MNTLTNILTILKRVNPYLSPILVGVLLVICIKLFNSNRQLKHDKITTDKRATTATKIIERYLDGNGSEHLVIEDTKISKAERKELVKSNGFIDTVAAALKIANNKINELTRVNATLVANNLKGKPDSPSNPMSIIRYVDKYANITYNPIDTMFGLKYNINLINANYTRNDGFLGLRSTNVVDLYSEDKRVTINGVERFSLAVPDPNFGLKGQIKAQYNFKSKSFTPAATIEANFKSYTIESNLFYNISSKQWTPTLGIKKDLFSIK